MKRWNEIENINFPDHLRNASATTATASLHEYLYYNIDDNLDVTYTAQYAGNNVELKTISMQWIDKVSSYNCKETHLVLYNWLIHVINL